MKEPEQPPTEKLPESGFWHDLKDGLVNFEERTALWMLQAADPTRIELQRLQSCFRMTDVIRQARETADHEYLTCLNCGYEYFARGTLTVQPCQTCGGCFFAVSKPH